MCLQYASPNKPTRLFPSHSPIIPIIYPHTVGIAPGTIFRRAATGVTDHHPGNPPDVTFLYITPSLSYILPPATLYITVTSPIFPNFYFFFSSCYRYRC